MRIAIDGMLLGRRFSGVEGSIANLARALAASGKHEYTLFTQASRLPPSPHPSPLKGEGDRYRNAMAPSSPLKGEGDRYRNAMAPSSPLGGEDRGEGFATQRFGALPTRWPVRFRPIRILWEQLVLPPLLKRGCFDLLHAPGYVAPLLSPVSVVVTLYDLLAFTHPEFCTAANRLHYRLLVPLSLRKAARIIVPSEATRRDLLRCMPAVAGKVRVIPLGIGDEFRPARDEAAMLRLRGKYGLAGRFILFVGGLEPKKNLARLIESYRLLRLNPNLRHQLVIAGALSWDRDRVQRAARAQGVADSVLFTGFVPPEELPTLYAMADLFVFPSLYEGFGLPPLEAMACGTPAIVSDRGALPEIAGRAARIVDPLSPEAIAGAMEAVLTNPAIHADLRDKGLACARQFSWSGTAAATEAVYQEIGGS